MLINDECYRQIFTEHIKEINKSLWTFRVSSFGLNTCTKTSTPLINDNALFQSVPHVNHTLPQIVRFEAATALSSGRLASGPRFCSQLDLGRGCSAATNPARWKQESRVREDWSSHEPGALVTEIWRTRRRCDVMIGSRCSSSRTSR